MKRFFLMVTMVGATQLGCMSGPPERPSIRSVDFANFTFPWNEEVGDSGKSFTLKNGELAPTRDKNEMIDEMGVSLAGVWYGDATGGGAEEAIIFLSLQTGGSATPGVLYVYAWDGGKPTMIWSLPTGDRADGGFRKAYTDEGGLFLELNDPADARGDCCPVQFARLRYRWDGTGFRETAKDRFPIANP